MTVEDRFNEQYREGSAPWDIGKPDFNLIQAVTATPIAPCKTLEIGCGTGDNTMWLSQQGFLVVGVDASEIAIEKAREKTANADVTCKYAVLNFLKSRVEGAPFGFAFDRGCFHTLDSTRERQTFAKQVNRHLSENGLWLSLMSRLSWKWKGRSTVKIAERARDETTKALQRRREGRHFEAAFAGTGAGFQAL
jgi:2-polyprenyl-3-methyl-5-hydroxy-6-metoxy-1,4-benzoquinol methylase